MVNNEQEKWATVSTENFKAFAEILKRVEQTNVFPYVLFKDSYLKTGQNIFQKSNEVIKVFNHEGKWHYLNLRNIKDQGSIIQYFANRGRGSVQIVNHPAALFQAAKVADAYYHHYIKSLRSEHKEKPLLLGSTSSTISKRHSH